MKLQKLSYALSNTAGQIARDLAGSEQFHVTPLQFVNLVLTPDEQQAARLLETRLRKDHIGGEVNVGITPSRPVEFTPLALRQMWHLAHCNVAPTANPQLLERIIGWYERRLTLGHLANAFLTYCEALIEASPTPAHLYRAFVNINTVFGRCNKMTGEHVREAMMANPRDVTMIPRKYDGLRDPAIQAAVLIELLDEPTAKKKAPSMSGHYVLNLPSDRRHLQKTYSSERLPVTPENAITLTPL